MAFQSIPQAWIAAGVFAVQKLFQRIKDNFDALYGSLGTQSTGKILNPSFEIDSDADGKPDNWTISTYPGGSQSLDTANPRHGAQALKFTHPGGVGNGGGYATSDYIEITDKRTFVLGLTRWCSAAGMKVIVRIKYYDKDKVYISPNDVATDTSNPTSATRYFYSFTPPATARYIKVELHGGVSDTDVTGSAYFEDLTLHQEVNGSLLAGSSVTESHMASSAVSQSKLKTSTQEASQAAGGAGTTGLGNVGEYGFFAHTKISAGYTGSTTVLCQMGGAGQSTSYGTFIYIDASAGGSGTAYARVRYVSSSGEIFWLFIMRDKVSKKILQMLATPDHPGGDHPFPEYNPGQHEVIVVTAERGEDGLYSGLIGDILAARTEELCFLELFERDYEVDETSVMPWPTQPVTVGIKNDDWNDPRPVEVVKKAVPKPQGIMHRAIRQKG